MGTEFEDDNAKEKLRAMLNRQFGVGDVSVAPFLCHWRGGSLYHPGIHV